MSILDRAALAAYAHWYAVWVTSVEAMEAHLAEHGTYFMEVGDKGHRQEIPEVSLAKKAHSLMLEAAKQFGFTPSSRSGLVAPRPPADAAREFLFG